MGKVTLTYIGMFSLGKLLAIWTFVLGLIFGGLAMAFTILMSLLGVLVGGTDYLAQGLLAIISQAVFGVIGLGITSVGMFIFGAVAALVYNVILGVGGGIDLDFKDR